MRTIPFITSSQELLDRVAPLVQACAGQLVEVVRIGSADEALEFLGVELPDLVFIHFSDPVVDGFGLLDSILKDSWLLHSSIIAFCDDQDACDRLETIRSANIVVSLITDDVERFLPPVLDLIVENQRILFQRSIGSDLVQTISGSYKLNNNLIEANCYANLLCNYLYNANKINVQGKIQVSVALVEMLINAIEHGNCGINYDEKGAWLEEGNSMSALIEKKCREPAIGARRVLFEYTITPAHSSFRIADEGPGFDWRKLKDPSREENLTELHGRGIMMTRRYTKNLTYNDKGNEVAFEVEHTKDCANAVPGLFENMAPLAIAGGDVVIREGETGDFLYYIAKGKYDVLVNDKVVSSLSADDIFMGEMSFLLNNRRTATVRAATAGTLLRISKKDFVEAIKRKPQYALLLSRLLAQRIDRQQTATRRATA